MDPIKMMKMKGEFQKFRNRHPKVVDFLYVAKDKIDTGTVIEMKITPPNTDRAIVCNMKVSEEDIELLKSLM